MDILFQYRDARLDLEVCRLKDDAVLVVSYYKVEGGLKYLVWRYESVDLVQIIANATRWGNFLKRPYQPGQGCDGSIDACALALFVHACRGFGLDPEVVYQAAYEGESLRRAPTMATCSTLPAGKASMSRGCGTRRLLKKSASPSTRSTIITWYRCSKSSREGVWTSTWAA